MPFCSCCCFDNDDYTPQMDVSVAGRPRTSQYSKVPLQDDGRVDKHVGDTPRRNVSKHSDIRNIRRPSEAFPSKSNQRNNDQKPLMGGKALQDLRPWLNVPLDLKMLKELENPSWPQGDLNSLKNFDTFSISLKRLNRNEINLLVVLFDTRNSKLNNVKKNLTSLFNQRKANIILSSGLSGTSDQYQPRYTIIDAGVTPKIFLDKHGLKSFMSSENPIGLVLGVYFTNNTTYTTIPVFFFNNIEEVDNFKPNGQYSENLTAVEQILVNILAREARKRAIAIINDEMKKVSRLFSNAAGSDPEGNERTDIELNLSVLPPDFFDRKKDVNAPIAMKLHLTLKYAWSIDAWSENDLKMKVSEFVQRVCPFAFHFHRSFKISRHASPIDSQPDQHSGVELKEKVTTRINYEIVIATDYVKPPLAPPPPAPPS